VAKYTQQMIMQSLLKMLRDKSIDKITVKDICEMCEINRNTFYYYFSDIYQVLEALMSDETNKSLRDEIKCDSFYEEYLRRYQLILDNKKAVWHIYYSKNRDIILKYFYAITENFIEKYVAEEAIGSNLTKEDIKFIVDFYSNSIIGNTLKWLSDGMKEKQEELIKKMSISYEATIKVLIANMEEENNKKLENIE